MPSTFTPNKSYELQATGENAGTWGIKLDAVESIIDLNLGGRFNANVAGAANVTVTTAQAQNVRHILTGLLTGNIQYIFPNGGGGRSNGKQAISGAIPLSPLFPQQCPRCAHVEN